MIVAMEPDQEILAGYNIPLVTCDFETSRECSEDRFSIRVDGGTLRGSYIA